MKIVWEESTRNRHVGHVDGISIVSVERPQKHRRDGTKHDWEIVTLGNYWAWNHLFEGYDARDLESTKMAAEARVRHAVSTIASRLRGRDRKDECMNRIIMP